MDTLSAKYAFSFQSIHILSPHTNTEVIIMAKKGMKHYYTRHETSNAALVPEIQGKAKSGKIKARPLIAGEKGKVYHAVPHAEEIPAVFPAIDNDLAVENLENDFDMTAADRQDLK